MDVRTSKLLKKRRKNAISSDLTVKVYHMKMELSHFEQDQTLVLELEEAGINGKQKSARSRTSFMIIVTRSK